MTDYPTDRKRSGYLARYLKAIFASNAVGQHGRDVVMLVLFVASREDKLHYSKAPKFWRAELMEQLSITSPKAIIATRQAAIDAGLLRYIEGSRIKAPLYWTLTPDWLLKYMRHVPNRNASESTRSKSERETEHETEHETERILIPSTQYPTTLTTDKSDCESVSKKTKTKTKTKTVQGFESWYAMYPRKVAKGNAVKAYPNAIAEICKSQSVDAERAVELLMQWTQERLPSLLATDWQFRPYPATWLNGGHYRDEVSTNGNGKVESIPPAKVGNYVHKPKVRA